MEFYENAIGEEGNGKAISLEKYQNLLVLHSKSSTPWNSTYPLSVQERKSERRLS